MSGASDGMGQGVKYPLPQFALSVRQPWAWAIMHAGKDIENRTWRKPNPSLGFRGRVAIHASTGITKAEYAAACGFMREIDAPVPEHPRYLELGYIVGTVEIVDVVRRSCSPWFMGSVGLVLRDPEALPRGSQPRVQGALGFFDWKPRQIGEAVQIKGEDLLPKWMRDWPTPRQAAAGSDSDQIDMFGGN